MSYRGNRFTADIEENRSESQTNEEVYHRFFNPRPIKENNQTDKNEKAPMMSTLVARELMEESELKKRKLW